MKRYAENTTVSIEKSQGDIRKLLNRYDAQQIFYGEERTKGYIAFKMAERQVKFVLPMPSADDEEITLTTQRYIRSDSQIKKALEQACRQRWRALYLVIKAKLEAAATGITTFEEEFLAYIMLPDGTTVGSQAIPNVQVAYETGKMPPLMIGWL